MNCWDTQSLQNVYPALQIRPGINVNRDSLYAVCCNVSGNCAGGKTDRKIEESNRACRFWQVLLDVHKTVAMRKNHCPGELYK